MKVIILAGGSGTRLWPLSREERPKQFIKFQGKSHSLFQETFQQGLLLAELNDIYVVTNEKHKKMVQGDVEELGYKFKEENILVEPEAKNTLPAIYAGVYEIVSNKGNDIIVVFPSDHIIQKRNEFANTIKNSQKLAENFMITFGIKPNVPHTGYGYISPGDKKENGYRVNAFKEKPAYKQAVDYIQKGYYWNAGIFMFTSQVFIEEVQKYATKIYDAFQSSTSLKEAFSKIDEKVSIDYGIMEKSSRIAVVPVDIQWNDLGSFDSFFDVFDKDSMGNIVQGNNVLIESTNNLIHTSKEKVVATIGVDDLIIIDTDDALLVCKKGESQNIKEVVNTIKKRW